MRSTYDRQGANYGWADASTFCTRKQTTSTLLSMSRDPEFCTSPATTTGTAVRGTTRSMVRNSSSKKQALPTRHSRSLTRCFCQSMRFRDHWPGPGRRPRGADLSWVPIGFEESFRMAYTRTFYGTGYYIFHQFVDGTELSRPIQAWSDQVEPDHDVLEFAWQGRPDFDSRAGFGSGGSDGLKMVAGSLDLPARKRVTVARLTEAPATIRLIQLSVRREHADALRVLACG